MMVLASSYWLVFLFRIWKLYVVMDSAGSFQTMVALVFSESTLLEIKPAILAGTDPNSMARERSDLLPVP